MKSTDTSPNIKPLAFLFDLDGTLFKHNGPIPGAPETISELRRRGFPLRFVTNATLHTAESVLGRLRDNGFEVEENELFTPAVSASRLLKDFGVRIIAPFVEPEILDDFSDFTMVGGRSGNSDGREPEAVLIGDLKGGWTHEMLNEALRYLLSGVRFVALQKGRFWDGPTGIEVDVGAYVAALEYSSGRDSFVCGKPNSEFFRTALSGIQWNPRGGLPVMVGDDLVNDIQGSQNAGWQGWLTLTGKTDETMLRTGSVTPDMVLGSVNQILKLV